MATIFQVGDRVVDVTRSKYSFSDRRLKGVIKAVIPTIQVQFDSSYGNYESGRTWTYSAYQLELVTETTATNDLPCPVIVHCPTKEKWDSVCATARSRYGVPDEGFSGNWDLYKNRTCLAIHKGVQGQYYAQFSPIEYFQKHRINYDWANIDSAEEFLVGWQKTWEKYFIPDTATRIFAWHYNKININDKKITRMQKISEGLKRIFNESQRKQYKTGLIRGDSMLTNEGANELLEGFAQTEEGQRILNAASDRRIVEAKEEKEERGC